MKTQETIIDCDGHILEPPDLWDKYLEPKYRERGIHICVDDHGFEYLEIDRKRAVLTQRGLLGSLGGMGLDFVTYAMRVANAPLSPVSFS